MPNSETHIANDVATTKTGRAFACPGLFRIVPALDGGICRIKLSRGRLASAQARAIAGIAAQFSAGAIEATNRANVQIRGIPSGTESDVIAALRAADLGAANAGADDVRNVMVSPLAGDDPGQIIDVAGLADEILQHLQTNPRYHALSPKFGIQIDGGESLAMLDHPNDIWLSAVNQDTFAFGLAGCPPCTGRDRALGFVAAARAADLVLACLDFFLRFNGERNRADQEISRFRHLLVDMSAAEIMTAMAFPRLHAAGADAWRRQPTQAFAHLGERPQRDGEMVAIGAVPPLGRLDPTSLRQLADLADRFARGEIRLTPWQSILLPDVARADGTATIRAIEKLGFFVHADAPLAAMITCAGSAGCASGHADTKSDALALAGELARHGAPVFDIHLSGCSKSCAAPRPAQATLVGTSPGRYDVFWRDTKAASKFGALIGADHSIEEASRLLASRHSEQG